MQQIKKKIRDNKMPLILFLAGHGLPNTYLFNLQEQPYSELWDEQLKNILGEFPQSTPMIIYINSCYSGSFITSPPGGFNSISAPNRIIITGAPEDKERSFIAATQSSDRIWGNLNNGFNLKEAFQTIEWWDRIGEDNNLMLDDNGDKKGHPPDKLYDDGNLAETTNIGVPYSEMLPLSTWLWVWVGSPVELSI